MKTMTAILLAMTATVGSAQAAMELKAGHSAADSEPYHIGLTALAESVAECTGNEVDVTVFANNQLGNEKEMIEGVLLGTVDITSPSNAVLTNFVPELKVFDLPFLFRDREHLYKVMDGPVGEELGTYVENAGFHLLGFFEAGIRHIMTAGKPVNSIDDLNGLKIRTMQNPVHVASFNAFGANATPLAYGELYGALESGVVDGAEAANSNYEAKKFYEVAPNWALVSWTALVVPVIMSAEKWAALDGEQQACFAEGIEVAEGIERAAYAKTDGEKLSQLEAQNVNITHPDPVPFREAAQKVYDEFITTEDGKRLVKAIQDTE
ncbi:MAG: TRAP transporter substrate-binding protein [Geminicoccaceae bacterium]